MFNTSKYFKNLYKSYAGDPLEYSFRVFLFNAILILLLLLHSMKYFDPYFLLTINVIVMASFILAALLLKARSTAFFVVALAFWLLAAFFKAFQIDVWAERTAIYVYESLLVGLVMLFLENCKKKITKR